MNGAAPGPHFPRRVAIEGYGGGGFRFGGMSHRGSILVLPGGIWAWAPRDAAEIDENNLAPVIAARHEIDLLLVGTGADLVPLPDLRRRLLELEIRHDVLPTAGAASTFNVLLGEGRRVAAALIAAS